MIATCSRPSVARVLRSGPAQQASAAVSRPFSVIACAQMTDAPAAAAASHSDTAEHDSNSKTSQVAKHQSAAVAPRAAYPAVRLPSLFHEMQREMDAISRASGMPTMLDLDPFFSRTPGMLSNLSKFEMPTMNVAVDIAEDDSGYTIKANVPGISKDTLKATVLDGTLTISGERCEENRMGGTVEHPNSEDQQEGPSGDKEGAGAAPKAASKAPAPLRYERSYGSFSRSFILPAHVDVEGIQAEAQDGVLTVTIPKVPVAKQQPKEIPVN